MIFPSSGRCLRKWMTRFLLSPGARIVRRRFLVGGLLLLTLLVLVARLEEDLEANTLVLQSGFPVLAFNKTASSASSQFHPNPISSPNSYPHPHYPPLPPRLFAVPPPPYPLHLPHTPPHQPSPTNGSSSSSSLSSSSLSSSLLLSPSSPYSFSPLPPFKMAAYVSERKRKWLSSGVAHRYRPQPPPNDLNPKTGGENAPTPPSPPPQHKNEATPLPSSPPPPSCQKLIRSDSAEQEKATLFMDMYQRIEKTPAEYIKETSPKNCSRFIERRGYVMSATAEEIEFPIAFSIMMYTGVEQAERLLRAIYRPHNLYCIHVDLKSPPELMEAMKGIAGCLPNVFIASKLNKVYWATWSSLEALIFCMEDLWKASKKWKYYINLTGQEFPLKTNLQLVRILRALNGSNIVDASTDPTRTWRWYNNFGPPHDIVPYKGMVFMMACRAFVDFLLHHPVAKDFLHWVRYTDMPDETYFPSLNHNPHLKVPGSYAGPPDTNARTKPYLARYVNWNTNWKDGDGRYNFRFPCHGMRVRNICIFGVRDLPLLTNRKELFVNKLYSTFEPLTLNCMEEWLVNMTIAEYAGELLLNTTFYSSLDIVRNKVV